MFKKLIRHYSFISLHGFTLIELIVVITLVGIMAVALLVFINPVAQLQKTSDTQRKNDLAQIQKSLETYYADHNSYPIGNTSTSPTYRIKDGSTTYNWGTAWTPYMDVLPTDPKSTKYYVYYSPLGQAYRIYASLDRGAQDAAICTPGPSCSQVPAGVMCGSGASDYCNYGVSSPNVSP